MSEYTDDLKASMVLVAKELSGQLNGTPRDHMELAGISVLVSELDRLQTEVTEQGDRLDALERK